MTDSLGNAYPKLAARLRKLSIASLPTPVSQHLVGTRVGQRRIAIKHDEQTSGIYGGNKVRKLEYLLQRAKDRGAKRVATFGTAGSNHALATAIHARQLDMGCTCFLAHQQRTPSVSRILDMHLELGTEIVKWGGSVEHLKLYRHFLQNRHTWVIPLGGSCWLGAVGFVNAGLELATQISAGDIDSPDRIYIANGTMGSVAGLAIGIAMANLSTQIHAVRVVERQVARPELLNRLIMKTTTLLNRLDPSIALTVATRTNVVWRDDFLAGGYAAVDDVTHRAVEFATNELGLTLETTYTGKAMAALQCDLEFSDADASYLFWNTYSSRALPHFEGGHPRFAQLPKEFARYYE